LGNVEQDQLLLLLCRIIQQCAAARRSHTDACLQLRLHVRMHASCFAHFGNILAVGGCSSDVDGDIITHRGTLSFHLSNLPPYRSHICQTILVKPRSSYCPCFPYQITQSSSRYLQTSVRTVKITQSSSRYLQTSVRTVKLVVDCLRSSLHGLVLFCMIVALEDHDSPAEDRACSCNAATVHFRMAESSRGIFGMSCCYIGCPACCNVPVFYFDDIILPRPTSKYVRGSMDSMLVR
jgi:hypothetical protein